MVQGEDGSGSEQISHKAGEEDTSRGLPALDIEEGWVVVGFISTDLESTSLR